MKIKWKFVSHMNMEKEHILKYESKKKNRKIRCEIVTPYKNGKPEKGKILYSIRGDKRKFETEEALISALKE